MPNTKKWLSKNRAGLFAQSHFVKGAARLYTKLKDSGTKGSPTSGSYFQCNGLGTDIFSLPVELLMEIFLMASSYNINDFDRTSAPLNLTQTCRLWRAISMGTPRLWDTFEVSLRTSPKNLELWIERANGHPLNLTLRQFDGSFGRYAAWGALRAAELWDVVKLHVAQLEHVRFEGSFKHHTFLSSLQPGMFSGLKSVYWITGHAITNVAAQSFEGFWNTVCSAPVLRKVTIMRIPERAPWSQLTHLDLVHSPFLPAIRAVSQCQNLTQLYLSLLDPRILYTVMPIVLPKLLDFQVRSTSAGVVSLFSCLSLPSLSRLTMRCSGDTHNLLESLHMLLTRSNAKLKHLLFPHAAHTEMESLLRILGTPLLSDLCSLSIHVLEAPGEFWKRLESTSFLPCLQELCIGIQRDNDINDIEASLRMRQCSSRLGRMQISFSLYDVDPYSIHINRKEEAEFLRGSEAWLTLPKKFEDSLVSVDFIPWAQY